jgi:hypothetical protein
MKRYFGVLIPAVGFILSAGIAAWLIQEHLPGYRLTYFPQHTGPLQNLAIMLIALVSLGALVLGLATLKRPDVSRARLLFFLAIASIVLGLLAAGYGVLGSQSMLVNAPAITFAHRVPFYAEAALIAALGFLVAILAMTLRVLGDRRG